ALQRDGQELLIEAVRALRPSGAAGGQAPPARAPDPEAAGACAAAIDRLTAQRRETSRDARLALVECVETAGAPEDAPRLAPLLSDFDPQVAARAATAIAALTPATAGAPPAAPVASPRPLPRLALPTDADLLRMGAVRVTLTLRGRGDLVVRLRPDEAPVNAFRFLRLAESGYYTGLTIHRVVPAFVAQGGSPGANEYAGDGPFTRDEVGRLSNLRGSIGLSTRGRDTGDAQFYVNLADNIRLDHTYTVFAQVESGMDVADALVEGDVIERVTVR
ncbi:MAG: peptidylprolyl isomerase, partial [Vicinamibacterales bacterium]|nr:peptidylprolyl isomerase [Vicinamibacterales bacterium]